MSSSAPQAFVKNHTLTLHSEDLHVPQPWPAKGITIDARSLSIQLKLVLVWPKDQEQTVEMEIFSEGCFRVGGRWPDAAHEWSSVEASGNCVMPIDSSSVGPEVVASNTACWYSWNQEISEPQTETFDDEETAFLVGFKWKLDLGVTVIFDGGDAESGSLLMSCHGNVGILPKLGNFGAEDVRTLLGSAVKYAKKGSHSSAVRVWQCAIAIQAQTQGHESCALALTLHEMGRSYECLGDLQEATACIRRALSIRQKQLGSEHPETATTIHTLGALREKVGEHKEALECYWHALAVREAMTPESPEAAKTLHALGTVHGRTGNLHEALECYQRALTIREKTYGENHIEVAGTLHNMGSVHEMIGEHEEALDCLGKALAIRERQLGSNHKTTAATLHAMGIVYRQLLDYDTSLKYYQRALEIREGASDAQALHESAATLNNMGIVHTKLSQYDVAARYHQRALAIQQALGVNNPDTEATLHNLRRLEKVVAEQAEGSSPPVVEDTSLIGRLKSIQNLLLSGCAAKTCKSHCVGAPCDSGFPFLEDSNDINAVPALAAPQAVRATQGA